MFESSDNSSLSHTRRVNPVAFFNRSLISTRATHKATTVDTDHLLVLLDRLT